MSDFTNNSQTKKESLSWNKSTKDLSLNFVKNGFEKEGGLKKEKALNASTLSLYIEAYENANEANLCNVTNEDSKKKDLLKKGLNAKQINFDSISLIQNPFEFSRQQDSNKFKEPEIAQFTASQKLLNGMPPLIQNSSTNTSQEILMLNNNVEMSMNDDEIARYSPPIHHERSPSPFDSLSFLASDTSGVEFTNESSAVQTPSDVILYEPSDTLQPSVTSLAMRINIGTTFKPPNKKACDLTEKEIQALLKNQKHRDFKWITEKDHIHSFGTLYYQQRVNDIPQKTKFDRCQFCNKIYSNTGGLIRHRNACKKVTNASTILPSSTSNSIINLAVTKDFDESEKRLIARALAECSLDGLLPYSFVLNPSTSQFIVSLINMGVQRKLKAPEEPSLPSRYTVKNYSMVLSGERQALFRNDIEALLKFSTGALSVDYGERLKDYLCGVLHYIKEQNVQIGSELLSDVIKLINIVNRKKNVQEVLGKKLHTHCETRFLSNLMCLRDIESSLETLYNSQHSVPPFIVDEEQILFGKIYDKRRTLRTLIEIFALYEYPVVALQSSNEPTIHKVWPITMNVIQKLESIVEKSDPIGKSLAKASLAAIERKTAKGFISDTHKLATVLNPSTRKLGGVAATEKQNVYRKIRGLLEAPSTQINRRPLLSMEADDEEADELSAYLNGTYTNITGENFDLLDFWYNHRIQFPQLFKIAMNTLCIPATSCSPERGFSTMKNLITDKRMSLDATTVTKMMIGKSLKYFGD